MELLQQFIRNEYLQDYYSNLHEMNIHRIIIAIYTWWIFTELSYSNLHVMNVYRIIIAIYT